MKRTLIAAAGFALFAASGLASAASWTVIVQPGVYGRVAIGGYAEPPMVYAPQPVIAVDNGYGEVVEESVDAAYATDQPPVYLWVPEYQRLHWAQYCREYGAYGVPVYFVDDGWYRANVMRRNWSPEQRSWSQQQWLEQDRLARDRFERQRFEHQRYEQQRRWEDERAWRDPRQQRHGDDQASQQARWERERALQDGQNRMRWGSARGNMPQPQQSPTLPQAGGQAPRPQPGGQWQPGSNGGGHWQPGTNGGGHPGEYQQGGYQQGSYQQGGYAPGGAGNGGYAGQQPQPTAASQPRGADRRGDDRDPGRGERADRGDRRGQGEARGGFERGHGGSRDR